MAPYLGRNPPVDIIDLWPGAGLWSSKVHEFLKPRHHVLIEPEIDIYGPLLKELVAKDPSYTLMSLDLDFQADWKTIIGKHLPEQGPSCSDTSGTLAKNDTLLILANHPPTSSKRSHYTPGRWWTTFIDLCMRQAYFHQYGSVRMLGTFPTSAAQAIVPRTLFDRKRPALLTETVALHAFEAATPMDSGEWTVLKGWDNTVQNAARVAERTEENKIKVPPGRELRAYTLAPEAPEAGRKPSPYVARARTDRHDRLMKQIEGVDMSDKKVKKTRTRAIIQLNQENRSAWQRANVFEKVMKVDELNQSMARVAAESTSTLESLKPYMDEIAAIESSIALEKADLHFDVVNSVDILVDDRRASFHTGTFDRALLPWDRRPFDPLLIDPSELYPRESDRSMIYFEADKNPPVMQILQQQLDPEKQDNLLRLFDALSLIFSQRSAIPVTEVLTLMFPNRPVEDLIRSIPSLVVFAQKTPKPNFDNLPKTFHSLGLGLGDDQDPAMCLQDNMDYDLSKVRMRSLFVKTLWEIVLEYSKTATDLSPVLLNRLLGGSMTTYQSGGMLMSHPQKLR